MLEEAKVETLYLWPVFFLEVTSFLVVPLISRAWTRISPPVCLISSLFVDGNVFIALCLEIEVLELLWALSARVREL